MKIVIGIIIAIVLSTAILLHGAKQDETLHAQAECVIEYAKEQGYAGNPNSVEAWNLFIEFCEQ